MDRTEWIVTLTKEEAKPSDGSESDPNCSNRCGIGVYDLASLGWVWEERFEHPDALAESSGGRVDGNATGSQRSGLAANLL